MLHNVLPGDVGTPGAHHGCLHGIADVQGAAFIARNIMNSMWSTTQPNKREGVNKLRDTGLHVSLTLPIPWSSPHKTSGNGVRTMMRARCVPSL